MEYNIWKFGFWIRHALIFSQFRQFPLRTFFAPDLLLGKFSIWFAPTTSFARGCFGISNDGFCKRFKILMSFSCIPLFSPDFNKLHQHGFWRKYLRSRLIIADDIVFICDTPQIFIARTKEAGIEIIFLRFSCKHWHFISCCD
jgi:hypothetical protein